MDVNPLLQMVSAISSEILNLSLDQQNEVMLSVYNTITDRRVQEIMEIESQSMMLKDRKDLIIQFNESLKKGFEPIRVGESKPSRF